jgi:hypothetical protein
MKLIERSSQRLTLQNHNYPPIARTIGMLCLAIGGLFIILVQPAAQGFYLDLAIEQIHPLLYCAAAAIMALGLWTIATDTTTKVSFDRHQSCLQIVWHRFWKEARYSCHLHEIVDVQLEKSVKNYQRPPSIEQYYDQQGMALPHEYVVWRINLILASGHTLPLTEQFNSDYGNGEDIEKLCSYIKEFLAGQPRLGKAYGVKLG